jgi:hypothetical protein
MRRAVWKDEQCQALAVEMHQRTREATGGVVCVLPGMLLVCLSFSIAIAYHGVFLFLRIANLVWKE